MASLRDRWRRCAIYDYFASMAPTDRAVAWVVLLLVAAIAAAFSALLQSREASVGQSPRLTAPPFTLDFAAVTR